jgi:hypothetical protein
VLHYTRLERSAIDIHEHQLFGHSPELQGVLIAVNTTLWVHTVAWVMISVNDTSRVTCELCHNLEQYSRVINCDPRGIIYTHY